MSQQGTLKCYQLIIEAITGTFKPSFKDLQRILNENGFEPSSRTLQRYIEHIRIEFELEIAYDKVNNVYYLDKELSTDISGFLRYLDMMQAGETLRKQANTSNMNFIAMDNEVKFKGVEWIDVLLPAMRKHQLVEIEYQKFGTTSRKSYKLQPYLLKEYQSRWYLFARLGDKQDFRTFGLDRIRKVTVQKQTFRYDKQIDPKKYFNDIVGLVYGNQQEVQEIQLAVEKIQAEYLRSLPLHSSQQELGETESEIIFSYRLIPNYELTQKILMQTRFVRVLKPAFLRKEIAEIGKVIAKNNGL
jgi:predicted DNA-binding transcriptional regulator YafY